MTSSATPPFPFLSSSVSVLFFLYFPTYRPLRSKNWPYTYTLMSPPLNCSASALLASASTTKVLNITRTLQSRNTPTSTFCCVRNTASSLNDICPSYQRITSTPFHMASLPRTLFWFDNVQLIMAIQCQLRSGLRSAGMQAQCGSKPTQSQKSLQSIFFLFICHSIPTIVSIKNF